VDTHAHLDRFSPKRTPPVCCSSESVFRAPERDKEGVALRVDLDATVTGERLT